MQGDAFRHLRELVDAAEDNGSLQWSLNAAAVLNGSTKSLAELGDETLRRNLEERLRPMGPGSWAEAFAYEASRQEPLQELYELLGLDPKLRHHRRPLTVAEKAQVVRSLAGELQKQLADQRLFISAPPRPWCSALLREMASAILALCYESFHGRRFDGYPPVTSRDLPIPLQTDVKLSALLRSGSAREITDRLIWLSLKEPGYGDQITLTLAVVLPRLNDMRLLVFSRVLCKICKGEENATSPVAKIDLSFEEHSSLACTVVRAVLRSDLISLPFELDEQIYDVRCSPFLPEPERNGLLELMAATAAPTARTPSPRGSPKGSQRRGLVRMPVVEESHDYPLALQPRVAPASASAVGRGAQLRALRRPAARMQEPVPQARPRRPRMNDSFGFGYDPSAPSAERLERMERLERFERPEREYDEPVLRRAWRPPSLPPSPRQGSVRDGRERPFPHDAQLGPRRTLDPGGPGGPGGFGGSGYGGPGLGIGASMPAMGAKQGLGGIAAMGGIGGGMGGMGGAYGGGDSPTLKRAAAVFQRLAEAAEQQNSPRLRVPNWTKAEKVSGDGSKRPAAAQMRRDLDGDSRHEDPAERVSSEEPSASRTTGGRQNSSSRVMASKTKFSMPDSAEIARMRDEYLQNAPVYPCFPKRFQPFRVELYFLLEEPSSSASARVLSIVIFACIVLSIALFMLETMPELQAVPEEFWVASECFFTVVFLLEYLARLLVFDVTGVPILTFIRTPMNVVDVVAVLPFFVIVVLQSGQAIGFIRAVRLVRLFRIFKLGRYSTGLKMMMVALGNSGQALSVLVFFLGIGCVLFSSVVYHVEKLSCPDRARFNQTELATYLQECHVRRLSELGLCCNEFDAPVDFPSILSTFWWSIVTMTTVGYGDTVPRTNAGKVAGAFTMCSGILLLALPIALIGARFQEAYNMAVSSRGSPSLQVRRKAKEREDPPTKTISTRLEAAEASGVPIPQLWLCTHQEQHLSQVEDLQL
ncbi:KCNB2 [Symbiodinium necroappetens]|uniref:KCNB2 protein n=1 Tax=Symbiodinium necroappetens TaxID=1628268 RepID=A0A812SAD0_9DINO|nr:KCNB2 [Symbiodinium necroappetens]